MAPRSVLMERRERFQPKFPMEYYWTATLTFTVVLLMLCGAAAGAAGGPFKHLFGIGDSFIDTGNRDPTNNTLLPSDIIVNQDWTFPYGISLGAPVGRYSDGLLFFDYIAAALGLNPVAYRKYAANPSQNSPAAGVNFATAGAGVFTSYGFTTTGAQITELQGVLATNNYNLSQSIVLYSVNGNDYGAYILKNGLDFVGLLEFTIQVVGQIAADVVRLFNLGFTNIAITQLPPLGCEPVNTRSGNYTACVTLENLLVTFHNSLLVSNPSITLHPGNIIFLDFYNAFNSIFNASPGTTGFSSPILKPCCDPTTNTSGCGYVDSNNKPLYTLCNNPAQRFFWDSEHPTQAGWAKIYNLLLTSSTYTGGRRSLLCFLFPQLCQ